MNSLSGKRLTAFCGVQSGLRGPRDWIQNVILAIKRVNKNQVNEIYPNKDPE